MSDSSVQNKQEGERGVSFINAVLDAHPAHIAIVNQFGEIVTVNRSWLQFAEANDGLDSTTLLPGGNYLAVCDAAVGHCAQEAEAIADALRSILACEKPEFKREYSCHSPNELRWFTVNIRGFEYEGERHAVISHINCTSEHLDRDHFKKLSLVARATSNAVVITDAQEKIEWVNAGFTRITGYSAAEVLGRRPAEVLQGPETCQEAKRKLRDAIKRGKPIKTEILNYAKDGRPYWLDMDVQPIRDENGLITNFIAIESDITERVEAEQKIRAAQAAAEAATKAKGDFLANMSHELRTPLTAILGFADIMSETTEDQEEVESLTTIRRNGQHLLELINNILDLSKIESGSFTIESIPTDPRQIIEDVLESLRVQADSKNVQLHAKFGEAVPKQMQSDPLRFKQIVMNLVGNAIKFTEFGEVCVDVCIDERHLQVDVIDTGIGMKPDAAERLFQPFAQADESVTRKFGGTGLGLTISKRLSQQMGGDLVLLSSEVGKGTRLRITLPCPTVGAGNRAETVAAKEISTAQSSAESATILSGRTIMLVEDGVDNQRLISHILKKRGAQVQLAVNGQECVDMLYPDSQAGSQPDLILMDMQMPVLDGYQATRQLRDKGCTLPIIALTAHAMTGDREKCLEAGCDEFATKPIDRDRLISCIVGFLKSAATASS